MRCFIANCKSSSDNKSKFRRNGGKSHFFRAPKTEERLQIWQDAISASGCQPKHKLLKSTDSLCHLHFKHDDISWTYPECKMPDGKIVSMEKEKPNLKENAVPSVFPKKVLEYAHFLGDRKVTDNGQHPHEDIRDLMETRDSMILPSCEDEDEVVGKAKTRDIEEEEYFLVSDIPESMEEEEMQVLNEEEENPSIPEMCRICATVNGYTIPIFKGEGLEHDLCSKINKHLPIEVTEKDTLPLKVCYHCAATLLAWDDLKEGCLEAQKQLLRLQAQQVSSAGEEARLEQLEVSENFKGEHVEGNQQKDLIDLKNAGGSDSERCGAPRTSSFATYCSVKTKKTQRRLESAKPKEFQKTAEVFNQNSTPSKVFQYSCEYCGSSFERKSPLKYHLINCTLNTELFKIEDKQREKENDSSNRHRRVRQKLYPCMHCDYEAKRKKILDLHTLEVHPELLPSKNKRGIDKQAVDQAKMEVNGKIYYHCTDCGKNLYSPYTFSWHKRIHTGERPFTCHLCGKQFRVNQGLARHLRETHAGIKKFPCDICGRMFTTKRNVEEHRRIHTGERPYVCNICGKAFKQKASLFVHNRTHSDLFPFKCSYCNQGFRTKTPLMVHITKHTGEKPYACDICNRHFRIKFELKRHRLVHFDEKPWQCTDCDQSFRQKRYLVNHRKVNHESIARE